MILVRNNVYKDVCLFENVFKFVICFENVCDYFENSKDVCFESEKVTKSNLPTQKVLDILFLLL